MADSRQIASRDSPHSLHEVIGCRSFGEAQVAYMWDLKSGKWWRRRNFAVMFSQVGVCRSKFSGMKNEKFLSMFPLNVMMK